MRPALRTADLPAGTEPVIGSGPIVDGTRLKRAPNDVGGLLDTSKGWTLNSPMPSEAGAATRAIAQSQEKASPAPHIEPAAETRLLAAR